jgi:MarR family 2-MHQ and catechol resistance regulon transcriptional repressor
MSAAGPAFINAVLAAADALLRESQRLFRPHGLTAAQYNVLNVIAARADGLSQQELSEVLVVDRSNVTGLIDRMEKSGWVKRADDPDDRRAYRVTLTAAGRRLFQKVQPLYLESVWRVTAQLRAKPLAAATAALRQLEADAAAWRVEKNGDVARRRTRQRKRIG